MTNGLNKYLHGTVWVWSVPGKKQGQDRLALVISNSQANMNSDTVNCVSVTSGIVPDYINVPLEMGQGYQIQCDQIHTVQKEDLTEYVGALTPVLLAEVKAQIRNHFDMEPEKEKTDTRKVLLEAVGSLTKMVENDSSPLASPRYAISYTKLAEDEKALAEQRAAEAAVTTDEPEAAAVPDVKTEQPDADESDKPIKKGAGRRKKNDSQSTAATHKQRGGRRPAMKLSVEDEDFILDTNNSTDEILTRFGFRNKRDVYDKRNQIKQKRAKMEQAEQSISES